MKTPWDSRDVVTQRVRSALGRAGESPAPPAAPAPPIDEPITRLVHTDIGLPELFAKMARENQMAVERVSAADVPGRLVVFLQQLGLRNVAYAEDPLVEKLKLIEVVRSAGITARSWRELTLDEVYDCDCGVTGVDAAIAETGSLVIRGSATHGRALSLIPPVHVAIVEPKRLLPDLVDLFQQPALDSPPANRVIITGPSKTADIELTLVTGVHGPKTVHVFLLT